MDIIIKLLIIVLANIFIINRLDILNKKFNINVFFFFTNLTIIIAMFYYLFELVFVPFLEIKLAIVLYIFLVMIIYNFILVPKAKKDKANHDFYSVYDIIAHIIIPILILIDWIFLTKSKHISKLVLLMFSIYPILYSLIVFIKAEKKLGKPFKHSNNHYPYFFFEIDKYGVKKIMVNLLVLIILMLLIGYIFLLINNYLLI